VRGRVSQALATLVLPLSRRSVVTRVVATRPARVTVAVATGARVRVLFPMA
jgi:hypothetical protein